MIVVLGGGMDPDGRLHRSSTTRVDAGVALWRAGVADRLHFSGGARDLVSAGERMAARARAAGVPVNAITTERQSQSTLQNALFSRPTLRDASIILVTEKFHLPRAWASFQAMGLRPVAWAAAPPARATLASRTRVTLRESLAVWFNLGRWGLWRAAGALGVKNATRDSWLH
ncbi:MAG: YdcF family protein [Pseudomonadota bacterium]